ncbi:Protein DEL-7 [Aphelenchoides avenae]|nr:Protein DEL-7 [Aphelenchus avenae]
MVMFPAEWGAQPSNFFKRHYIPQHSSSTFSLRMRYTRMLDSNPNCIANCPFIVDDNVTSENCALSSCYYELWLRRRVSKPLNCAFFYTRNAKHDEICDPDVVVRKYDQITDPDLNGTKCLPACERDSWDVTRTTSFGGFRQKNGGSLFATIEIYYDALEYESYEEVRTTSVYGFIGELGGQSSLFIGASLLVILEVLLVVSTNCF